jgi:electron transfer flavoprotein beta subunit
MEIIVFVKQVPDTESRIVVKDVKIDEEGINFILNPYDEFAVEEGLRLKEKFGGKVTAVTVGPERAISTLRKVLAMGVDDAILIKDDAGETYDPQRISKIISEFIKKEKIPFDILFFGKQAIGDDNMGVPAMVAEFLGLPQVTVVTKLEIDNGKGKAWREIEGASEVVEFKLPAVLSAQKGLNEPRYETLKGIMAAKKKEIRTVTLDELGLKELQNSISILKIEPPPPRPAGKILKGTPEEMVKELLNLLRNEAKVI